MVAYSFVSDYLIALFTFQLNMVIIIHQHNQFPQFRHCCRPTVSESQVLSRIAMKAAQADNRILAVGSALSDRIQPRNSSAPEAAEMEISVTEVTAGHTHL